MFSKMAGPVGLGPAVRLCEVFDLLLFVSSALCTLRLELLARLFELRFLLSRQYGKRLLVHAKTRGHQLRFKRSYFRELLAYESFIECAALARLSNLLPLGANLFHDRTEALATVFVDLLYLSLLRVGQIKIAKAHHIAAASRAAFMPLTAMPFTLALVRRLREGNRDSHSNSHDNCNRKCL